MTLAELWQVMSWQVAKTIFTSGGFLAPVSSTIKKSLRRGAHLRSSVWVVVTVAVIHSLSSLLRPVGLEFLFSISFHESTPIFVCFDTGSPYVALAAWNSLSRL